MVKDGEDCHGLQTTNLTSFFKTHKLRRSSFKLQSFIPTHQHVLELDIAMHQTLAVQKPDPLHHIKSDQQPASVVESSLDSLVQVTLESVHDQQHCWRTPSTVTIVNH